MLDKKLQIKPGQSVAIIDCPIQLELAAALATPDIADSLVFFVHNSSELSQNLSKLSAAAQRHSLLWLAYPKAGQLNTDLNRDGIRKYAVEHGLDTVRQIAIDDTWSALRLKQS
jgi:hypothetical protein